MPGNSERSRDRPSSRRSRKLSDDYSNGREDTKRADSRKRKDTDDYDRSRPHRDKKTRPDEKAPSESRSDKHERDHVEKDYSRKERADSSVSKDAKERLHSSENGGGDPGVTCPMTEDEKREAERLARIAALAEEKAMKKASGAADKNESAGSQASRESSGDGARSLDEELDEIERKQEQGVVVFLTKKQREQLALRRLKRQREAVEQKRREMMNRRADSFSASGEPGNGKSAENDGGRDRERDRDRGRDSRRRDRRDRFDDRDSTRDRSNRERDRRKSSIDDKDTSAPVEAVDRAREKEIKAIKEQYLSKKVNKKKVIKASEKFAKIFQFDWEADEDTSQDFNPLYNKTLQANLLFGRGYRAGIDPREQRMKNTFLDSLAQKRQEEESGDRRGQDYLDGLEEMRKTEDKVRDALMRRERRTMGVHWSEKPLEEMMERDWRILKEDFDIQVKGGKAPNPLRNWKEGNLPESVMKAIKDMKYIKPSPIQMQCIPIGLQHRDIIGIAETGSGKTAAFTIPMLQYIMSRPRKQLDRTNDEGPLAVVMAPTRELAQQIETETNKLCYYTSVGTDRHRIKTALIVGGESIEEQGFKLRRGVEIVIGTPGRLIACIESRYLVLNQASYVVLDEADRMIDMGFEPQVVEVLESMGGLLKSENEEEAEQQIEMATKGAASFRITCMFSATMPPVVEKLAKTYLRHPAIVKIGDEDSGKNKRIEQVILFVTEGKKFDNLVDLLRRSKDKNDKVICFVNVRTQCDIVGRKLSKAGFYPAVLHGGKTQEQRVESLEGFRDGSYDLLVATNVAGRGLDIPDVTHVINYDLPSKIEDYTHRIGRTGRAGKEGLATSFLTENDEDIMYDLKNYLQSTENAVPAKLASHPAAKAPPGARREDGKLVREKKDKGGGGF